MDESKKIDTSKLSNRELFNLAFPKKKQKKELTDREKWIKERRNKINKVYNLLSDIFPVSVAPTSNFQKLNRLTKWRSVLPDRGNGFEVTYEENLQSIELVRKVINDLKEIESLDGYRTILCSHGALIYEVLGELEERLERELTGVVESNDYKKSEESISETKETGVMSNPNKYAKQKTYSIGDDLPPELL